MTLLFQSTPPVKAATILDDGLTLTADISIHAAREGGDATVASAFADAFCISIHAAREGGDPAEIEACITPSDFNPRRP